MNQATPADAGHEQDAKAGAGEGSSLPRGLSVFRFVLFSGLLLGAAYAGLALALGSPPPPGYVTVYEAPASEWQPSPIWLPVYLLIKAGVGVRHTPEGYVFTGQLGYALFGGGAMTVGILLGGLAGWFAGERIRQRILRKRAAFVAQVLGDQAAAQIKPNPNPPKA
ncbi:MAG: hypothetical protein HY291_13410 [Planctomycetes bacterium]|nr:hypothetical protein [Planctomycetota bacterium]